LYDLVEDPLCKESIALKEENVQLVAQMHDMLLAGWQKSKP
jgi:hypothetical protein